MQVSPKSSSAASTAAAVVFTTSRGVTATEMTPLGPWNDQRSGMGVTAVHATTLWLPRSRGVAGTPWRAMYCGAAQTMRRTCPTRTARSEESGQLTDPDAEIEPLVHQ